MVRAKSSSRFTGSHIYGSTGSEPPNPWIPSAMAMAMSIYRTLCVLVSVLDKRLLSDIWVFCQKCYFEVRMDCKEALLYFHVPVHDLQASEEIFMDIYMCCFIATLGAVGNFLLHASMEQIRVFVAKSTLSRIHTFLVFIGLRFYSDIWAKKWRVKPLLCYSVGNEHFVTSWWPAVTRL